MTYVISISGVENDIVLRSLFLNEIQIVQASLQALDIVPQLVQELNFLVRAAQGGDGVLFLVVEKLGKDGRTWSRDRSR
jgi:hypothetical protein